MSERLSEEELDKIDKHFAGWADYQSVFIKAGDMRRILYEVREGRRVVETVKTPVGGNERAYGSKYHCGNCELVLIKNRDKFCPNCGVTLAWKE